MSAKFGAQRKRAFLTYLSQSGNQTLAAERAKVSRSWVTLHRQTDAAFDAACRDAVRQARDKLSGEGERRSGNRRWHYQDGHELVVAGSNGRRVQLRRARARQWTARTEARFLAVLAATANVTLACREVGMWPPSAYAHAARWPAFAARWEEALAVGAEAVEGRTIENVSYFLDPNWTVPEAPMPGITVRDAIRLLRMFDRRKREKRRG